MKKGILATSSLLIFLFGAIYLPPAQATGLLTLNFSRNQKDYLAKGISRMNQYIYMWIKMSVTFPNSK